MITVTIEGPAASGKTTMFAVLAKYCEEQGLSYAYNENITGEALRRNPPQVLFIEKMITATRPR